MRHWDDEIGRIAVVGATPSGLMASQFLAMEGAEVHLFDPGEALGGAWANVERLGCTIDPAGTTFTSGSTEISPFWRTFSGMLERPFFSRLYRKGGTYPYPPDPAEVIQKLPVLEYGRCLASWVRMQALPFSRRGQHFEAWGKQQFGSYFYELFYQPYAEKVWGRSGADFPVDWPDRPLSPAPSVEADRSPTYLYPKAGPSSLWNECAQRLTRHGGHLHLCQPVTQARWDSSMEQWQVETSEQTLKTDHLIWALPFPALPRVLSPTSEGWLEIAGEAYRFRDLLTVAVMVRDEGRFHGTRLEVWDEEFPFARIVNQNASSSSLIPKVGVACYLMQAFGRMGNSLFASLDEIVLEKAMRQLIALDLAAPSDFLGGEVIRLPGAVPIHDIAHCRAEALIRRRFRISAPRLHLLDPHTGLWDDGHTLAMHRVLQCVERIGETILSPRKSTTTTT